MQTDYDSNNVFAKILRGEIPSQTFYESEHALAFPDIAPKAAVHLLVIPKGAYVHLEDFIASASAPEQADFWRAVREVAAQAGIAGNFRLMTNNGKKAGQEVPHFHVHLLSGTRPGEFA